MQHREGHAPPGDALTVRTSHRQNGKRFRLVIARRPQADVAISGRQSRFRRECPVIRLGTARLPRRFAPRNDTSGECGGAPAPSNGLMTPYKALTDCRYTPYFGAYRLTTADTSRRCFPEIAPQGHFLALRAQGATAPLGPRNDKSRGLAPPDHKKCAADAALPRSERHGALRPQRPAPWGYLSYRPRQFYAARRT